MKDRLFRELLPQVSKPARYSGGEVNIIKKNWEKSQSKMVFAFPDVYEVGMSHMGGKILYGLVNEKSEHLMERSFAPWPDMEAIMREKNLPLYSLESFRPLKDFDIVGFSLQYELGITNVLNMLDLSGIPLCSAARKEDDPLVVAGGPVAFNPEPFAEFFDLFILGDGEEVILEFLDNCHKNKNLSRRDKLMQLAGIEGIYIPEFYGVKYHDDDTIGSIKPLYQGVPARIKRRLVKDLDKTYFPARPIVPYMGIVHDRAVLEVMRGCLRGCRFCHAGTVYRPVRERSTSTLEEQARTQLMNTGYEEVSLASLSTLDYSGVDRLVKNLVREFGPRGIGISLPSLRVDAFSIDLANEVQKIRKTTLTLAPEAGTQRMRDIINKNIDEGQLMQAVEAAFKSGWFSLKLYFMIGLPGESRDDLDGILDLVQKVRDIGMKFAPKKVEVRVSLASFVPKAHTPFQWRAQNSITELEEKRKYMSRRKYKNIKLSFHDSRTSFLEGVIARGDRRLSQAILKAWQKGCKFDGWTECFRFETWMEAFEECGINPEFYALRQRQYNECLPWDIIETGINKEFFIEEDEKAAQGITTPDCRKEACSGCGLCPSFEVAPDIKEGNYAAES